MKKVFCKNLPIDWAAPINLVYPNFVYIDIIPEVERMAIKSSDLFNQILNHNIKPNINLYLASNAHLIRNSDHKFDNIMPENEKYECHANIHDGRLSCLVESYSTGENSKLIGRSDSEDISIADIVNYNESVTQIPMRYVALWNGHQPGPLQRVECDCFMNSFSGELDFSQAEVTSPGGTCDREYVVDADGNEHPIFENEAFDGAFFVQPLAFVRLMDALSNSDNEDSRQAM